MSDLPSGCYLISPSTNRYNYVGRHASLSDEDTISPENGAKKVLSLPLPLDVEPPKWVVEKLPSGRYRLRSLGAPTTIKGGLLWTYEPISSSSRGRSSSGSSESSEAESEDEKDDENRDEWCEEEWVLRPYRSATYTNKTHQSPWDTFYTIQWASGGAGWVRRSDEPYTQIAVAPLSGQGKEEELWTVVHVPAVN